MSEVTILEANLDITLHSKAVLDLINAYASDEMGNGAPLDPKAMKNLIPGLKKHPTTILLLAFKKSKPIGILSGFEGFSTFQAKPVINISDFYILPDHRGRGTGRQLLEVLEEKARNLGCCKITLEVQENNTKAKKIYTAAGFRPDVHVPEAGHALFISKPITYPAK